MKVGDKVKGFKFESNDMKGPIYFSSVMDKYNTEYGTVYEINDCHFIIEFNDGQKWCYPLLKDENEMRLDQPTDTHYNNENGSLYLFAEQHGLNAWEFDIIKRITRCRKKGQFIEDLEKTKRVIDLYIKEYDTTANR